MAVIVRIFVAFGLVTLFALPTLTFAQSQLVTCEGPDCNFCSVIQLVGNVIDIVVLVAVVIATIMLAIAGFKLVASKGNPGAMQDAKNLLINICIGILLVMAAWTLVDTLMKLLIGDDVETRFGPWNEPRGEMCGFSNPAANVDDLVRDAGVFTPVESTLDYADGDNATVVTVSNEYGQGGLYGLEGGESAPVAGDADGQFSFNAGISAQLPHASRSLSSMLNCMARRVPANVGRISSISDDVIVNGQRTFAQCAAGASGCDHVANSRHYGGSSYTGQSYAVDFGDEENVATLCAAANACGRVRSCSVHNGNHVHLDLYYPNGS